MKVTGIALGVALALSLSGAATAAEDAEALLRRAERAMGART